MSKYVTIRNVIKASLKIIICNDYSLGLTFIKYDYCTTKLQFDQED